MNKVPVGISEKKRINQIADKVISVYQKLESYFVNEKCDFPSKMAQKILLYFIYRCMCLKDQKMVNKFDINEILDENELLVYLGMKKPIKDNDMLEDIYSEMLKIITERKFEEIIFYILEVFEYIDVTKNEKKKSMGIYYTPDDVVKYMVDTTLRTYFQKKEYDKKNIEQKKRILHELKIADLSCGTGIFLVYAVRFILPYYSDANFSLKNALSEIFSKNIWGIDISEKAVETARILLLLDNRDIINNFGSLYKILSFNIQQGDSIEDKSCGIVEKVFPQLGENSKFSCIIGNPPYSYSKRKQENLQGYVSYTSLNTDKMYLYFIENMIYLSDKESVSSMIVPLAIAYNTSLPFRKIRKYISEDNAEWNFAFFDRSPDSIFGDDVKTRVAIIFRNSNNKDPQIRTTGLIRWNSQNRDKLFKNIGFHKAGTREIEHYIFKSGHPESEKAYLILNAHKQTFVDKKHRSGAVIYYYPTAYNWLSFFLEEPLRKSIEGETLQSNAKRLYVSDDKDLVYALLCSTLTYWLWIGIGDIFHVSTTFVESLPYNTEVIQGEQREELIKLGKLLWKKVQDYSVYSNNAGIITLNYAYICCLDIIHRINCIICNVYHLSDDFVEYLKVWYLDLVCAGRTEFKYNEALKTF